MLSWLPDVMREFRKPWFVAGGWALDLFAGAQSRHHADVDLAIWRDDQLALRSALPQWSFEKVVDKQLVAWNECEFLELPVHEIHARHDLLAIEFLLNERRSDRWMYRRNPKVTLRAPL